jgi:hypothetical protein
LNYGRHFSLLFFFSFFWRGCADCENRNEVLSPILGREDSFFDFAVPSNVGETDAKGQD